MSEQPGPPAVPAWDLADRMRKALRHSGVGVQEMADYLDVTRASVGESVTPRIQCCPEDTYDTDAAGELRPTCSCGDGCECICPDCYCWPEDDEI